MEGLLSRVLPFHVALTMGSAEVVERYASIGIGVAVVSAICLRDEDRTKLEGTRIPAELGGQTTYGLLMRERKHFDASLAGLLSLFDITRPRTA